MAASASTGRAGYARCFNRAVAVLVGSVAGLTAWPGAASEPLRLSFAGAPGCNDPRLLEREIARRAPAAPERPTTVTVRIANGVGRVDAVLFIQRAGGEPVMRAVSGASCQEVIEASALIIAVLASRPDPGAVPPAEAAPREPSGPEPDPVPPSDAVPPVTVVPTPPRPTWRFGAGLAQAVLVGVAPGPVPAGGIFADVGRTGGRWSPSFRLGLEYGARRGFPAPEGQAAFRVIEGVGAACPVTWQPGPRWTLRPCAVASYGVLRATGSRTAEPRAEEHPWLAAGGGVWLGWQVAGPLALELGASSEVAAVESRFWVGDALFHETAPAVERLSFGLVARPGSSR